MAGINLQRNIISVGVGIVDTVLENQDDKNSRVEPFQRWSGIARLLAVAGGYVLQVFMPRWADIGETITLSAQPLLVKSIWHQVQKGTKSSVDDFVPRRLAAGEGNIRDWAPSGGTAEGQYRRSS